MAPKRMVITHDNGNKGFNLEVRNAVGTLLVTIDVDGKVWTPYFRKKDITSHLVTAELVLEHTPTGAPRAKVKMTFSDGDLFEKSREVWFEDELWQDYGYANDGLCFDFTAKAFDL